jgi:hypothetical protein
LIVLVADLPSCCHIFAGLPSRFLVADAIFLLWEKDPGDWPHLILKPRVPSPEHVRNGDILGNEKVRVSLREISLLYAYKTINNSFIFYPLAFRFQYNTHKIEMSHHVSKQYILILVECLCVATASSNSNTLPIGSLQVSIPRQHASGNNELQEL